MFPFHVAPGEIKWHPGEGRSHLETMETCGCRGRFANLKDSAADSAPRPGGIYEKGSYLRCIMVRIKESILPAGAVVTSKEGLALAPASATGHGQVPVHPGFRHHRWAFRRPMTGVRWLAFWPAGSSVS